MFINELCLCVLRWSLIKTINDDDELETKPKLLVCHGYKAAAAVVVGWSPTVVDLLVDASKSVVVQQLG